MIITKFIKIKVNAKNIKHLIENGYSNIKVNDIIEIKPEHLTKGSHTKIKVKCVVCGKERDNLMYKEYLRNIKKHGYYSCAGTCSSDKNKKTCLEKYGTDNYSKTKECKLKVKKTNLEKFGVDCYAKTDIFKERFKETCLEKYGVDNPSKSKNIKEKRKKTMIENHGVEYYVLHDDFFEKTKETFIKNYGVDHPMKIEEEVRKRLNKKGLDFETDEYKKYRRMVDKFTKYNKEALFEKWDGKDYYDGEYIKDNLNKKIQDGDYPTIDHKKPVKKCFEEGMLPIYVAELDNLCITKRSINSKKGSKSEEEFKLDNE